MLRSVTLVLVVFGVVQCHKTYQTLIPNGASVPDPCNSAAIWGAVGHYNPRGSQIKNPFARVSFKNIS